MPPARAAADIRPFDPVPVPGSAADPKLSPDAFDPRQLSTVMLLCILVLKGADLSHAAADGPIHLAWVSRLEEEVWRQGDIEKDLGWSVPPLFDRTKLEARMSLGQVRAAAVLCSL